MRGHFPGYQAVASLLKEINGLAFVTLVDKNPGLFHNIAALRAVVEADFSKKLFVPYTKLFDTAAAGKFVQGTALSITPSSVVVRMPDSKEQMEIKYDYLVIATGTSNPFPGKLGFKY